MEVLESLNEIKARHRHAVLTIGNFDGIHLGHQKIIRAAIAMAEGEKAKTMAMTFEPHPLRVLVPDRGVKLMTPQAEKIRILKHFGINIVLIVPFTKDFAHMQPDAFIEDVLLEKLNVTGVVVGHNYAFGRGRKGTTEILRRRGEKLGFKVKVVRHATVDGEVVSSSRIRSLIGWGRVWEAAQYLGRPYAIEGIVVRGAGRGAKLLETPTANIETDNEVIPTEGVYAVRTTLEGQHYDGVANIGKNPTFDGLSVSYEVHLFNFRGNLRGKTLKVHFIDRIREERTFPSAEALHDQITEDIASAKAILRRKGEKLELL